MSDEKNSRRKFLKILDEINDFIGELPVYLYFIDADYQLLWMSKFLSKKFRFSSTAPLGTCYRQFWNRESPCENCPGADEVVWNKFVHSIISLKNVTDSSELYLDLITIPVFENLQELSGFLKIGFDVTAVEKDKRALREQKNLYSTIIESSADAIFLLDNDEKILSWNEGARNIFGYEPAEIIGKSNIVLIPKALIEIGELYYIQKELNTRGYIRQFETERINKEHQIIHVDLTRTLIYDEKGEKIGSSVIIKDITTRKKLELELRRTIRELSKLNEFNEMLYGNFLPEELYQVLLIAITAGEGLRFNRAFLFLIDSDNFVLKGHLAVGPADEKHAHLIWSSLQDHYRALKEVFEQYHIYPEGTDRRLNEIVRSISIPLSNKQNVLVQALTRRKTMSIRNKMVEPPGEYEFQINDQSLFEILDSDTFVVSPLVAKRGPIGVVVADNRITRKEFTSEEIDSLKLYTYQASLAIENAQLYKNLEDRIRELQRVNKMLEENSDRLVRSERLATIGEMSAKVAHEIRNPLVSIGGFARLLERKLSGNTELKNYATIIKTQVDNLESILNEILDVARPKKPEISAVDLHQIIHQVLMMLEDITRRRNIDIRLKFGCIDSTVMGDEKLLYQVVLNLLKNGIEAIGKKGHIIIATDCAEDFIKLVIMDTGSGIAVEHMKKIYDPFFTTKTEGTGLGLPIVRQIIRDHNGRIEIKSEEGKGTKVEIFLPQAQVEEKRSAVE